jgi:hypothetical protein
MVRPHDMVSSSSNRRRHRDGLLEAAHYAAQHGFTVPVNRDLLAKNGITVGQFGIYVLLSYAAGNLLAALGNVGENLLWRLADGMPTEWVVKPETTLIKVSSATSRWPSQSLFGTARFLAWTKAPANAAKEARKIRGGDFCG